MKQKRKKKSNYFSIKPGVDWVVVDAGVVIESSKPWLKGARTSKWSGRHFIVGTISDRMMSRVKKHWNPRRKAFSGNWSYSYNFNTPLNVRRGRFVLRVDKHWILNLPNSCFNTLHSVPLYSEQAEEIATKDTSTSLRGAAVVSSRSLMLNGAIPLDSGFAKDIRSFASTYGLEALPISWQRITPGSVAVPSKEKKSLAGSISIDPSTYVSWSPHVLFDSPSLSAELSSYQNYEADMQMLQQYFDKRFPLDGIVVTDVSRREIAYISDGSWSPECLGSESSRKECRFRCSINLTTGELMPSHLAPNTGFLHGYGRQGPLLYLGEAITFKATRADGVSITPINFYVAPRSMFVENLAKWRQDVADMVPPLPDDELVYIASAWCQRLTKIGSLNGTYDLHNSAISGRTLEHFMRFELSDKIGIKWKDTERHVVGAKKAMLLAARQARIKEAS